MTWIKQYKIHERDFEFISENSLDPGVSLMISASQLEDMDDAEIVLALRTFQENAYKLDILARATADQSNGFYNLNDSELNFLLESGIMNKGEIALAIKDLQRRRNPPPIQKKKTRRLATAQKRKISAILAEQSGWECHYCACPLASPQDIEDYTVYGQQFFGADIYRPEDNDGLPEDMDEKLFYYSTVNLPSHLVRSTLDHKVPCSKGGGNEIENLVLCCHICNSKKGYRRTYEEYRAMTQEARDGC